ncbi:hypothetical protein GIB67_002097 [Kingdonia uniflora]|uniref:RNase H type-1 domain-containing protein n=1 Tax=Kingdonia uniflora TaxID=39325 RepID=A0A7J7KWG4_9MAGN|nr:hypothetical protein GIB67_002097 [Kingdonia uniflora]
MFVGFGWEMAWIEYDSVATIHAFKNEEVLWVLHARWKIVKTKFTCIKFSSIWREANFSADSMSKNLAILQLVRVFWGETPLSQSGGAYERVF